MPAPEVQAIVERFNQAHAALDVALKGISEEALKKPPGGEEWAVGQVLSHVEEMERQWVDKAVLMTKEKEPFAGRTEAEQARRLDYVKQHSGDSLAQHQKALDSGRAYAVKAVSSLKPADLPRTGKRADGTTITVHEMLTKTVCDHIVEHARQVQDTRKKVGG